MNGRLVNQAETRAANLRELSRCRAFNPGTREELVNFLERQNLPEPHAMLLREVLDCELFAPDGREACRAAADLFSSRANVLKQQVAS